MRKIKLEQQLIQINNSFVARYDDDICCYEHNWTKCFVYGHSLRCIFRVLISIFSSFALVVVGFTKLGRLSKSTVQGDRNHLKNDSEFKKRRGLRP